jgi:low temperature requirement protein LtrA
MAENVPDNVRRKTRPRLLTLDAERGERHASWLELFFDLVFVLAVAQVAQVLVKNSDLGGVIHFAVLFVPVWWSWIGFTFYADRFESNEPAYRVLTFGGMLGVGARARARGRAVGAGGGLRRWRT